MKEHPIIFNGDMVRAILAGRKTQTRRVIKPQPDELRYSGMVDNRQFARFWTPGEHENTSTITDVRCPYGVPGNHLWVRETWAIEGQYRDDTGYCYRADGDKAGVRWRSPRYMPRVVSRITLKITGVRVERVQDIAQRDAIAEGIESGESTWTPIYEFRKLWDSINANRGYAWDTNPWVWVIEFAKLA